MKIPEPVRTGVLTLLEQHIAHERWILKNRDLSEVRDAIDGAACRAESSPPDILDCIATMCGIPKDNSDEMLGTPEWPTMQDEPSDKVHFRDWIYWLTDSKEGRRLSARTILKELERSPGSERTTPPRRPCTTRGR